LPRERSPGSRSSHHLEHDVTINELTQRQRSGCLSFGSAYLCPADEPRKVPEEMQHTTFAPQLAHVAVGARPCDGLDHGYQWLAVASAVMNSNFMSETTIKRPARRLGRQPT
jgi:hypothetical protein